MSRAPTSSAQPSRTVSVVDLGLRAAAVGADEQFLARHVDIVFEGPFERARAGDVDGAGVPVADVAREVERRLDGLVVPLAVRVGLLQLVHVLADRVHELFLVAEVLDTGLMADVGREFLLDLGVAGEVTVGEHRGLAHHAGERRVERAVLEIVGMDPTRERLEVL